MKPVIEGGEDSRSTFHIFYGRTMFASGWLPSLWISFEDLNPVYDEQVTGVKATIRADLTGWTTPYGK